MMRRYLVPASMIAALALSGAAMAATTTTGKITSFDMKTHQLKLDNDVVYMLPADFKDPGLKAGEKVAVTWNKKGSQYDATTVSVVK